MFIIVLKPITDNRYNNAQSAARYADRTSELTEEIVPSAVLDLTGCTTALYDWSRRNFLALDPGQVRRSCVRYNTERAIAPGPDVCLSVARDSGRPRRPRQESRCRFRHSSLIRPRYVQVCKGSYYHIHGVPRALTAMSVDVANVVAGDVVGARLTIATRSFSGLSEANRDRLQPSAELSCSGGQ